MYILLKPLIDFTLIALNPVHKEQNVEGSIINGASLPGDFPDIPRKYVTILDQSYFPDRNNEYAMQMAMVTI
jgi:hypothetical protein